VAHCGEGHFNQIRAVAWVPWAFLAFECFRAEQRGGLLLLCIFDASSYSRRILRVQPPSIVTARSSVIDELLQNAGDWRVLAAQNHWSDYAAVKHGIQKIQGYEPVPISSYAGAFDAMTPAGDPITSLVGFERVDVS